MKGVAKRCEVAPVVAGSSNSELRRNSKAWHKWTSRFLFIVCRCLCSGSCQVGLVAFVFVLHLFLFLSLCRHGMQHQRCTQNQKGGGGKKHSPKC